MRQAFCAVVLCIACTVLGVATPVKAQEEGDKSLRGVIAPTSFVPVKLELKAYNGELKIIRVADNGGQVTAGQDLLVLDDTEIKEQLDEAQRALDNAKASFANAETELKHYMENNASRKQRLEQTRDDARKEFDRYEKIEGPIALENSTMSVERAKDGLSYQKEELEQLEKMYRESDLAVDTQEIVLNRAKRQIKYAEINLRNTETDHKLFVEQDHPRKLRNLTQAVEDAERELRQYLEAEQFNTRDKNEAAANAKRAREKAEKHLNELRADLAAISGLKAPQAGTVLHGEMIGKLDVGRGQGLSFCYSNYKAGDTVKAGDLFVIYTPGQFEVLVALPEAQLGTCKVGQAVTIELVAASGKTLAGKVTDVSFLPDAGDNGRVFWTRVFVETKDDMLRPGLSAKVKLN